MKKFLSIMLAAIMSVSSFALVSSANEAVEEENVQPAAKLVSQVNETGSKIPNTYAKIKNGQNITLGYFGGSVTNGYGPATQDEYHKESVRQGVDCWRGLSKTWLNETYGIPNGITIEETDPHAGLGGTGINLNLYRADTALGLSSDTPVDLLFIEFSINDSYEGSQYDKCAYYMESTLRMIREKSPTTDVIVMLTTDHTKLNNSNGGTTVHEQAKAHIDVAEHYGIPWFWFGGYMYDFLVSENEKLGNGRTLPSATSELWYTYYSDGCHPHKKGYAKYFEFLKDNFLIPNLDNESSDFSETVVNYTVPEVHYNQTEAFLNGHRAYHTGANSKYYNAELRENATSVAPELIRNFGKTGYGYNPTGDVISATTTNPGHAFTVKVKAKSAGMFYTGHPDKGMIQYRVDGGDWKYHNMYTSSKDQHEHFMFFENLEEKEHTVDVILRKTANGSAMKFRGIFVDGDSTGFGAEILEGTPNNTPLNDLVQTPIVLTPTLLNTKISGNGSTNSGSSFSVYHHGVTDTDVLRYVPNPASSDTVASDCYNGTFTSVSLPTYKYAVIKYYYELEPGTTESNAEGNRPYINFLQLVDKKSCGLSSADKLILGGVKANNAIIDLTAITARTGHKGSLKQMHFQPYGANVKGSSLVATELMNIDSISFYAEYPFNEEYDIKVAVNADAGVNVNLDGKRILPSAHKYATVKYTAEEDTNITLEFNGLYDLAAKNYNKTFTASKTASADKNEIIIPLTEIAESGQIHYYTNVKVNSDKAVHIDNITFSVNYPNPDAEFEVVFDANGGEGNVPAPIKGKIGHVAKLPTATLTNGTKLFLGWAKAPDSQEIVSEVVVPADGMTLYAVYADAAKLTYNANGGTGTCPLPVNVVLGNKTSLLSADLTKGNAIFIGWGATADATTTISEVTMVEGGITVYAIYKELDTVYVAADGKITYNEKEYDADYASVKEAYDALGTKGGHIVFEGAHQASLGVSGAPIYILEGANSTAGLLFTANTDFKCNMTLKNMSFFKASGDPYFNINNKKVIFDEGFGWYSYDTATGTRGSEIGLKGWLNGGKVIFNDGISDTAFVGGSYGGGTSGNNYMEFNNGRFTGFTTGTLSFSEKANTFTHNGNTTVVINGGEFTTKAVKVDYNNTIKTDVTGATSVIFNNGMAQGFNVDPKFKYIIKSSAGGKATLAAEGGASYAPTFLLKANNPNAGICIDGEEVATGEYLFMPKSTGTFEVTYTAATTVYASATGKITVDGKEYTAAATLKAAVADLDAKGGTIYFDGRQSYFELEAVSKMGFKNLTIRGVSDSAILELEKADQPAGFGCNVTIENCKIQKIGNSSAYMRTGSYVVTVGNPNDTYPVTILNANGDASSMEAIVTANGGKYIINSPNVTFSKLGCDWSGTKERSFVAEINNGLVSSGNLRPFYGGGTLNGHFAVTFNGGGFDKTAFNFENGCTVSGNGIFVFNNGLKAEKAYTFAGIDYIVDAPKGIKVEISDLGGTYNNLKAPTFTLIPSKGVEKVFVNKAEVLPVNGVYTYTPSAKGTFVVEADLVLPAITFAKGDATSGTAPEAQYAQAGAKVTLPTCNLAKEGYVFTGWTETEGSLFPIEGEYTTPEGDVTLYPVFAQKGVAYVNTDKSGKLTYNGTEYPAYATMLEALTALGATGGHIIFTGVINYTDFFDKLNASASMTTLEGIGDTGIIRFESPVNAAGNASAVNAKANGNFTLKNVKLLKAIHDANSTTDLYFNGNGKVVILEEGTKFYTEDGIDTNKLKSESTLQAYNFSKLIVNSGKFTENFHVGSYTSNGTGNRYYEIGGTAEPKVIQLGVLDWTWNPPKEARTHTGNVTLVINGGVFGASTSINVDKASNLLTNVIGAVSVVINNGIADEKTFVIDKKVEYIIKSGNGGTVELKDEGSETTAPKFLIKTQANKDIYINDAKVEAVNGEYTFVPAEKTTFVVTYKDRPVDVEFNVTLGGKDENSSVIVDTETGFDGRAVLEIEGAEPIYLEGAGSDESDLSATEKLNAGTYAVKVKKPGYITYTATLKVNSDGTFEMDEIPELIAGDIRGSFDETEGDGKIDMDDFIRVLRGFATETDNKLLRQCVDLNEDGVVNVQDLSLIKNNFGASADDYAE